MYIHVNIFRYTQIDTFSSVVVQDQLAGGVAAETALQGGERREGGRGDEEEGGKAEAPRSPYVT
jgi:hypothetical protein